MLNLALLATLQHLETAQFVGNNITNIYPPQAAIVANIVTLNLSYNKLHRIDMSVLRSMELMKVLNLEHNQLSTIGYRPGEVVTLPSLIVLRLSSNKLERVSFAQLNATSLEYLSLSSNMLNSLPDRLDNFPNLELLSLGNNQLESFDFTILQSLSNLQSLELYNNSLQSVDVPKEITLPSLQHLTLANNKLESVTLERLIAPHLSFIDLSNNFLMAIPDVFEKDVTPLVSVNVVDNPLTCATYEKHRKPIRFGVIIPKWIIQNLEICSTGTYFTLTDTRRVCCMA
uniref:Leucine rich immune protein (Coil-less) n=1 Tax=Anopheles maculatus TaxID=74869 RepID=A0A182T3U0_9DIPT